MELGEKTMRSIIQLAVAIAVTIPAPLHAQSNSTLRPSTDYSVTTGIGSSGSFRNGPPSEPPAPRTSGRVMVFPEAQDRAAGETDGSEKRMPETAAPPPAAEVKEDPRTMITRDRIESPQH
jgi:hypothetical protein